MSAEAVMYAVLSGAAAVTDVVGTAIYPDELPESIPAPAIVYRVISDMAFDEVSLAAAVRTRYARVQVDIIHKDSQYPARKALQRLVRSACHGKRGTIGGISAVVVRELMTGPDLPHSRSGLSVSITDFQVVYQQNA
jgi:hypothetical protein